MFTFRTYQDKAHRAIQNAIRQGYKRILMVGPPGIGKGTMIARVAAQTAKQGYRSLFAVHRRDLVIGPNALTDRLVNQLGIPRKYLGYIIDGIAQRNRLVMMGTIDSIMNRKIIGEDPSTHFKVVQIDEGHRVKPLKKGKPVEEQKMGMYMKLIQDHPDAIIISWTATPERHSKHERLGDVFDCCIQICTHRWAVSKRYLVPSKIIAPVTPDLSAVKLRAGEYIESDLEEKVYTDEVLESIADKVHEYFTKRSYQAGIVYTINSIKQCMRMRDYLREKGFRVEAITSKTKKRNYRHPSLDDRDGILERLQSGDLDLVVNVQVLTEGISIDRVDFICLAFASKVRGKYIQTCTRGSRPLWGDDGDWLTYPGTDQYQKDHFMVLDCGNNYREFGIRVEDYLSNGVNIHAPADPVDPYAKPPMKRCPVESCCCVNHASAKICIDCGFEFPNRDEYRPLAKDVEWEEVDVNLSFVMEFAGKRMIRVMSHLRTVRRPELLIPICVAKGKELSWAVEAAIELGYVSHMERSLGGTLDAGDKDHYSKVLNYLEEKVDRKGYRDTVNRIINNTIML